MLFFTLKIKIYDIYLPLLLLGRGMILEDGTDADVKA